MVQNFFLRFLALIWLAAASCYGDVLIHGYSIIVAPPHVAHANPRDANVTVANFYSYSSGKGYLTFGWFYPAALTTNFSRVKANTDDYDWYEYSDGDCQLAKCNVFATNYNTSSLAKPASQGEYDTRTIKTGSAAEASIAFGYTNQADGIYTIGTRDLLGMNNTELGKTTECNQAFATLGRLRKKYNPPIKFNLTNPCAKATGY